MQIQTVYIDSFTILNNNDFFSMGDIQIQLNHTFCLKDPPDSQFLAGKSHKKYHYD